MDIVTFEQLAKIIKPEYLTNDDSDQLANELIAEYQISDCHDIAEFLGVNPMLKTQRAVRVWVEKNLSKLDKEESFGERYRQLRNLFQQKIPDFM